MPETIEMHDKQAQAQGSHDVEEKADHAEADENYPPSKVSIPTILCIYLAFLLCALVSLATMLTRDDLQNHRIGQSSALPFLPYRTNSKALATYRGTSQPFY